MTGLFSTLIDFMEAEELKYDILEGESVIRFHFKTTAGRLLCYGEVDEESSWLIFYSYLPVNVPPEKLAAAAEFISRANRGLRIGNFELDFEDGEVRYKTSIDIEGGELVNKIIDNLLRANLSTMNRYFSGIMGVIYGERPATYYIRKIEHPDSVMDEIEDDDDMGDDDDPGHIDPNSLDLDLDDDDDDDDDLSSDLDLDDDDEDDDMDDEDEEDERRLG